VFVGSVAGVSVVAWGVSGGPTSFQSLYGDALEMRDDTRGGDDQLTGGGGVRTMLLYGDAGVIDGNGRGGDDTIVGGAASVVQIYGDAGTLGGDARGGDDTLTGSASSFATSVIHGDAGTMEGDSRGGDDTLIAGSGASGSFATSLLLGDAGIMRGNASGGDDTLTGSTNGNNILYGDGRLMYDQAAGGDDRLISGAGTDHMWGDAQFTNDVAVSPGSDTGLVATGTDTFVFGPNGGTDDIGDFRQSDGDRIDVSAWGFTSLVDMMITFNGVDTTIGFDAANSVTLIGFAGTLHTSDFVVA
jgi:hypothetical protein